MGYPTLAKSVGSSSINIDDGSDTKVNIATSKNVFAALEGEDDDDGEGKKRPTEIKPAMVTKKKGEREKVALQREVDKYSVKKDGKKKALDKRADTKAKNKAADEEEGRKKQPKADL